MGTLHSSLAVVDLETTGSQPAWDRITEIGVIEVDGFEVSSEWSTLVNPGAAIPAPIQAFTGISSEMVARAPSFASSPPGFTSGLRDACSWRTTPASTMDSCATSSSARG